ncbi:alpha/beta fold hydrolase [Streptomyces sp. 8N706]|uniref:alpha/beta fold hydrolase n=1 Tax=Streptomyces sp. 8N706 TaxID=3457416 RepID=UPI003FD390CA
MPATVATVSVTLDASAGAHRVPMAYERRGNGEPLLLLHGIGHHRQAWDPVLDTLATERDVVAVDLPGFGESPALPDGVSHSLSTVVPALGSLCEELGIERPHVAGNSMGGMIALELGRQKLVRSVTALSPGGFWSEAERRYAFGVLRGMHLGARLLPPPVVEQLARTTAGRALLVSTIYARPGRRSPEGAVAETLALRKATGFGATLAEGRGVLLTDDVPDVPVTIAWGTRDRVLVGRQGIRAKYAIPGARLVRLRGCGHVPMSDDPALVARVLLDGSRPVPAV